MNIEWMNMLRCYNGHFVISAKKFRKLQAKHGAIADMWCSACEDYVAIDSHENMVTAGYA